MPLSRILVGRRSVVLAGRRFVVRPPMVRTFLLALRVFGKQLGHLWEHSAELDEGGLGEVVAFACVAHAAELRELLSTCVEQDVDDLGPADLALLVNAALDQCSPSEAVAAMRRGSESESGKEEGGSMICAFAERFHISPVDVLDWPLDLFVEAYLYSKNDAAVGAETATQRVDSFAGVMEGSVVRKAGPVIGGPARFVPPSKDAV